MDRRPLAGAEARVVGEARLLVQHQPIVVLAPVDPRLRELGDAEVSSTTGGGRGRAGRVVGEAQERLWRVAVGEVEEGHRRLGPGPGHLVHLDQGGVVGDRAERDVRRDDVGVRRERGHVEAQERLAIVGIRLADVRRYVSAIGRRHGRAVERRVGGVAEDAAADEHAGHLARVAHAVAVAVELRRIGVGWAVVALVGDLITVRVRAGASRTRRLVPWVTIPADQGDAAAE